MEGTGTSTGPVPEVPVRQTAQALLCTRNSPPPDGTCRPPPMTAAFVSFLRKTKPRFENIGFVEILRRIDRLRTISEVIGMPRTYVTDKRLAILLHFGTCAPPRDRQTAAYILTMALLSECFRRRSLQHLTAYGTVPHRRFWLLLRSRKGVSPGSL